MTLRTRITVLVAAAVALAVTAVSAAAFVGARREVRGEIDEFLASRVADVGRGRPVRPPDRTFGPRGDSIVGADAVGQVIDADGQVVFGFDDVVLPVDEKDGRLAAAGGEPRFHDVVADGERYRVLTLPLREGGALQLGRSLAESDQVLSDLGRRLLAIGGAGVALAALMGWVVASRALDPVTRLTAAAEHVATTRDLTAPIEVDRGDELGRLAGSFNAMLAALATSQDQQRRLVLDAGHELRTPLTSLRTNIEVLARRADLEPEERAAVLADVTSELEELGNLVTELVDLAADVRDAEPPEPGVRIDKVVEGVVERARRRTGRTVHLDAEPWSATARPATLERAASNLIDNAVKWSPPDTTIDVTVRPGRVAVRDRGPGIDPADMPHVFDRFYRAPAARTMPGSGLGLAIVRQAAESHGGTAWAEAAPGGGARVGFDLPE